MKDHKIAELVNLLKDISINFHDHQSLRDRISGTVLAFINEDKVIAKQDLDNALKAQREACAEVTKPFLSPDGEVWKAILNARIEE